MWGSISTGRGTAFVIERSMAGANALTFLNSYRSVVLLNAHSPGTFFGSSNGSLDCQYSINPPSSAEITQSYLSLY